MDRDFPIEFRMKPGNKILGLALAVFLVAGGVYSTETEGTVRAPFFGSISSVTFGYIAITLGLVLGVAAARALAGERPKLVLNAQGFVFSPNFGPVREIAWVDISELTIYSNRYVSGVELLTDTGQRLSIPAFEGSAETLHSLMQSCIDRANAHGEQAIGQE